MKFYDTENGNVISEEELEKEFNYLLKAGETDCQNFGQYVAAVTGKNGTLELLD